jgi:transcription antitermination factor NusA-like protein
MEVSDEIKTEIVKILSPIEVKSIGIIEITDMNIPVIFVNVDTSPTDLENTVNAIANYKLNDISDRLSKPIVLVNWRDDNEHD